MSQSDTALILFTRLPIAGQTKTRLMPRLNAEECAELHGWLLREISITMTKLPWDLFVFYTPLGRTPELDCLQQWLPTARFAPQEGDTAEERMQKALQEVLEQGYPRALLLSSDIPFVTAEELRQSAALLEEHDVVLGPTEDGNYWLVGLTEPFAPLFEAPAYGGKTALEQARAVCQFQGRKVALGPRKRDINTPADLDYYL